MKRVYTLEYKKNFVIDFLRAKSKEPELSVARFIKESGLELSESVGYKWVKLLSEEVRAEIKMSVNEVEGKVGSDANNLSLSNKAKIVFEVSNFTQEQLGEYCRTHGIYAADINNWKEEIQSFINKGSTHDKTIENSWRKENSQLAQKCTQLERELHKKNESLATYAAKIQVLENFDQLFRPTKED